MVLLNNNKAITEAINQNGMSKNKRFFAAIKPCFPEAIAPNPKENKGSVMFEPIKVPTEIASAFFNIAISAVESSGKHVPTPIIIDPMND